MRLSPLCMAIQREQPEIVDFLLEFGANTEEIVDASLRTTPLCLAAGAGNLHAARALIITGASINGADGIFGTTPLIRVCHWHDTSAADAIVDLLISNGADINLCRPLYRSDNETHTALTAACSRSSAKSEAIERLLQHSADVNLGCPTPLEELLRGRQGVNTARLLLNAGAKVDLLSEDCIAMLRGIGECALDRRYLGWPWKFCREPEEKLQLLEIFSAAGSREVIEISSGEESSSDGLPSDDEP